MFRNSDPDTSMLAAESVDRNKGRRVALKTLLENKEGLTDYELAAITGYQQNSIGKRRGELRDLGLVVDSGTRRPAPSGAASIVWRAA